MICQTNWNLRLVKEAATVDECLLLLCIVFSEHGLLMVCFIVDKAVLEMVFRTIRTGHARYVYEFS